MLELTTYWSSASDHNHYIKEATDRKLPVVFSHDSLVLIAFSQCIDLYLRIQYKMSINVTPTRHMLHGDIVTFHYSCHTSVVVLLILWQVYCCIVGDREVSAAREGRQCVRVYLSWHERWKRYRNTHQGSSSLVTRYVCVCVSVNVNVDVKINTNFNIVFMMTDMKCRGWLHTQC